MRFLVLCSASLLLAACGGHTPEAPLVAGQARLRPGDTLQVTVWSVDQDGDSLSYRVTWGDGQDSGWSRYYPSGDKAWFRHAYSDTGTFAVVARTRDHSDESAPSDSFFVRAYDYGPNRPTRPRLASDTSLVGTLVGAMTSATHPLDETVSLQVYWGDSLGDWSDFVRPGEHILMRHSYSEPGRYMIRARARDAGDRQSDWSDSTPVVIIPVPTR